MNIENIAKSTAVVYFLYFVAFTYLIQENSSQKVGLFFCSAICISMATKNQSLIIVLSMIISEFFHRFILPEAFQDMEVPTLIGTMQENEKLKLKMKQKKQRANNKIKSLTNKNRLAKIENNSLNSSLQTANDKLHETELDNIQLDQAYENQKSKKKLFKKKIKTANEILNR